MRKIKIAVLIAVYIILCLGAFNYLVRQQQNTLRKYFIEDPQERAREVSDSLAGSLSKYFIIENKMSTLEQVGEYIKRYSGTPLFELVFIYKDPKGTLTQFSKDGVSAVSEAMLKSRWVYPVSIDNGNLDGYLAVMIKDAGGPEMKEGLRKYLLITYSMRFLFVLFVVALAIVVLYNRYSAKMKLARDIAEIKASNDGMTGMHTHEHFMKALDVEVEKFRLYNIPVALLMLDIDFFKKFNDTYGHQAGDRVLQEVATIIKANTRATDILARYGGEEFAVIIPYVQKPNESTDKNKKMRVFIDEIKGLAERIRENVEKNSVDFQMNVLKVTVSIGAAYYYKKMDGISSASLLEKADKALYKAKKLGRNRVSVDFNSIVGWHE